jgi:L-ascorbate metabolism protein UlaG (beta-lactamase superfamily)
MGDNQGENAMKSIIRRGLVAVLFGTGIGTGRAQIQFIDSGQSLGTLKASSEAALGDIDGDGDLDAFIVNGDWNLDQPNEVWINDGRGFFTRSHQAFSDSRSGEIALGDLDGDRDLDAWLGYYQFVGGTPNEVWFNDGTGTFTDGGQRLGHRNGGVRLADLDNDGDLDAFNCNHVYQSGDSYINGGIQVWTNDGSGVFTDSGQDFGDGWNTGGHLGDIDGDGDVDALVTANSGTTGNTIWFNDGTGRFTESLKKLSMSYSPGLGLADLDGDGDLDAFVLHSSLIQIWKNDGTGDFSGRGQRLTAANPRNAAMGDLDGDGDIDAFVACGEYQVAAAARVFVNDGTGTFTDSGLRLGDAVDSEASLGDLDGDGDLDVFLACTGGNKVFFNVTSLEESGRSIEITCVANEGFLVSGGGRKVLIDGIFTESWGMYSTPPAATLTLEREARAPFDSIDALLFTHDHADHIHAGYTVQHLSADPSARLACTTATHTLLKSAAGYEAVRNRILELLPGMWTKVDTMIGGMRMTAVRIPHSGDAAGTIQLIGWIVRLNGFTLFHAGDAGWSDLAAYDRLNLDEENIDIAFLPYFSIDGSEGTTGRTIVGRIAPKRIVLMHVPAGQGETIRRRVEAVAGLPPVTIAAGTMKTLTFDDSLGVTAVRAGRDGTMEPGAFELRCNYPNPFNPSTTIRYTLARPSTVRLTIHDSAGRTVRSPDPSFQGAGEHALVWDGRDDTGIPVPSGQYLFGLEADGRRRAGKMILIR